MIDSGRPVAIYGNYRLLTKPDGTAWHLGHGSFGSVYRAVNISKGDHVALKVLHDRFVSNARIQRTFQDEAREHRRLNHPHVVRILEVGKTDSTLYLAMDLCDGGDLHHWVANAGQVPFKTALNILRPIADAMVYASGHGLVHRDIKPSNILLLNKVALPALPVAKLADFGLAKKVWEEFNGGSLSMSQSGGINGTLQYASPEQIRQETLDTRSDIFSFGLTLWHVLHGGYPFPDQKILDFMAERSDLISYQDRFPGTWPEPLKDLMARMVAGPREHRFPDFGRLVVALDRCLEKMEDLSGNEERCSGGGTSARPQSIREFFSLQLIEQNTLGSLYEAKPVGGLEAEDESRQVELLRRDLPLEIQKELKETVSKLAASPHPFLSPMEWRRHREGDVIVIGVSPHAPTLLHHIQRTGARRAVDILPWLEEVATALDHAALLDLPGVETAPGAVSIVSHPETGIQHLVLTPRLSRVHEESGTLYGTIRVTHVGGRTHDDVAEPSSWVSSFSRLAYWLFSSHAPRDAAMATPTAYISCATLSEQGNTLLRSALCGRYAGRCVDLLSALAEAEGLRYTAPPPAPAQAQAQANTAPPSAGGGHSSVPSNPPPSAPPPGTSGSMDVLLMQRMLDEIKREREEREKLEIANQKLANEKRELENHVGELEDEIRSLNERKEQAEFERQLLESDVSDLLKKQRQLLDRQEKVRVQLEEKEEAIRNARLQLVADSSATEAATVALKALELELAALKAQRQVESRNIESVSQDLVVKNSVLEKANHRILQLEEEKRTTDYQITQLLGKGDLTNSGLAQEIAQRRENERRLQEEIDRAHQAAEKERTAATDLILAIQRDHDTAVKAAEKTRLEFEAKLEKAKEAWIRAEQKAKDAEEQRVAADLQKAKQLAAAEEKHRMAELEAKKKLEAEVLKRKKIENQKGISLLKKSMAVAGLGLLCLGGFTYQFPRTSSTVPSSLHARKIIISGTIGRVSIKDSSEDLHANLIYLEEKEDGNTFCELSINSINSPNFEPKSGFITLEDAAGIFKCDLEKVEDGRMDAPKSIDVHVGNDADLNGIKPDFDLIIFKENSDFSRRLNKTSNLNSIRLPRGNYYLSWAVKNKKSSIKIISDKNLAQNKINNANFEDLKFEVGVHKKIEIDPPNLKVDQSYVLGIEGTVIGTGSSNGMVLGPWIIPLVGFAFLPRIDEVPSSDSWILPNAGPIEQIFCCEILKSARNNSSTKSSIDKKRIINLVSTEPFYKNYNIVDELYDGGMKNFIRNLAHYYHSNESEIQSLKLLFGYNKSDFEVMQDWRTGIQSSSQLWSETEKIKILGVTSQGKVVYKIGLIYGMTTFIIFDDQSQPICIKGTPGLSPSKYLAMAAASAQNKRDGVFNCTYEILSANLIKR